MKKAFFYVFFLVSLHATAQTAKEQHIPKLTVNSRKVYHFNSKDSSATVTIDTLIMKRRSTIELNNKKTFKLIVKHAFIEDESTITGTDSKNNGTDLTLTANFESLKNLTINTAGVDAKIGNQKFPNGNGGNVTVNYLASGAIPQTSDKSKANYIQVLTKGGGGITNIQDLYPIMTRINTSINRPLSNLPNGQVYSAVTGKDGKVTLSKTDSIE